jgi:IMP cyclohydrolase
MHTLQRKEGRYMARPFTSGEREEYGIQAYEKSVKGYSQRRIAQEEIYAGIVPHALDNLTPEERYQIYRMLRLNVVVGPDGRVEVTGAIRADPEVCNSASA